MIVRATLLASVLTVAARGGAPDEARPLLVIGLDGADRGISEHLWDRGLLPDLGALAARGPRTELGPRLPGLTPP